MFNDHQLVIAKIKVKLKGQKRKTINVRRFDTSKLIDPFVESQFWRFLQNRFSALADPLPGPCEWWDELKNLVKPAGEEVCGFKKMLKEAWISNETWNLVAEWKDLHQKTHNATDVQNW